MANLRHLKNLSENMGISIRELADMVGVSENQIHLMCRTNSTKIVTLEKIARVLGVPASYFFDEPTENYEVQHVVPAAQLNRAYTSGNGNASTIADSDRVKELEAEVRIRDARIADLKEIISEKDARIADLKERIEDLKLGYGNN